MKKVISILLYIYVSLAGMSGQEVSITSAFDTSSIYLGDQINFTVTIEKPASYMLLVPIFKDTLLKKIEILSGPLSDTSLLKNGRVKITQKYLITSFDSGFYQVPPVYAELTTEGMIKRFYSDYSPLEVLRVKITPPDTTAKIFDIVRPYKAPLTMEEVLPWILLTIVVGAIAWYAWRLVKKLRRPKDIEEEVVNPDPAHLIAFRELEKLKAEKLWQNGEIKRYYTRLSEIVRQYLENRFLISSLELTTVETLKELINAGLKEDEPFRKIRTVLTGADLVKFAKYNPEPPENDMHYDYAWDFVSETRYSEPDISENSVENQNEKEGAL
jgi:hypothetical protein